MTATMLDRLLEKTVADAIGVALPRRRRERDDNLPANAREDRREHALERA